MAGTQFSSDSARAGPGRRHAGAGPLDRRIDREQRQAAPRPAKGQEPAGARPASQRRQGVTLGHPGAGQASEQRQPPDFGYVQLLSQHVNMQGLGRESPFGVRASLTGEYRQILSKDQVPFDVLEDL